MWDKTGIRRRVQCHFRLLAPLILWSHAQYAAAATTVADPASLARLHDIITPAAVNLWWPLAPGWHLLAALVLLAAVWFAWRTIRQRQKRRYRIEALAELRALRGRSESPGEMVAPVLILLKRTALAAYPRSRVASLNGERWWRFLDETLGKTCFADGLGELAEQAAYRRVAAEPLPARDLQRLYRAAEQWIRGHRVVDQQARPGVMAGDWPGTGS